MQRAARRSRRFAVRTALKIEHVARYRRRRRRVPVLTGKLPYSPARILVEGDEKPGSHAGQHGARVYQSEYFYGTNLPLDRPPNFDGLPAIASSGPLHRIEIMAALVK